MVTPDCFEKLAAQVQDLSTGLRYAKEQIRALEDLVERLSVKTDHVDKHSKRKKLRLFGVAESFPENCRDKAIQMCAFVLPQHRHNMYDVVSFASRYGVALPDQARPIIVHFSQVQHRDAVLKNFKACPELRDANIRFAEDLCETTLQARKKLWPSIKAARDQGKQAYFCGSKAIIDGIQINP
ncbi:putative transposase [Namao virus]|nr:putative transposase [Namao virus]